MKWFQLIVDVVMTHSAAGHTIPVARIVGFNA